MNSTPAPTTTVSAATTPPPISGFTVIRNARLTGYPILESIRSLLPLVDEFVIGVGQSDDDTKAMIESLNSPKIKIFDSIWDPKKTKGGLILSEKTNEALDRCTHDWCFYLQADEVTGHCQVGLVRQQMVIAQLLFQIGIPQLQLEAQYPALLPMYVETAQQQTLL